MIKNWFGFERHVYFDITSFAGGKAAPDEPRSGGPSPSEVLGRAQKRLDELRKKAEKAARDN
jgi:hypothetical protein